MLVLTKQSQTIAIPLILIILDVFSFGTVNFIYYHQHIPHNLSKTFINLTNLLEIPVTLLNLLINIKDQANH